MSITERIKQIKKEEKEKARQQKREDKERERQARLSANLEPIIQFSESELNRFKQLQLAQERLVLSGSLEVAREIYDNLWRSQLWIGPDLTEKSNLRPNDFDSVRVEVSWDRQSKSGKARRMVDNTPDFERYADVRVNWEIFEQLIFEAPIDSQSILVRARRTSSKPDDVYQREDGLVSHFEFVIGQYEWSDRNSFREKVAMSLATSSLKQFF